MVLFQTQRSAERQPAPTNHSPAKTPNNGLQDQAQNWFLCTPSSWGLLKIYSISDFWFPGLSKDFGGHENTDGQIFFLPLG